MVKRISTKSEREVRDLKFIASEKAPATRKKYSQIPTMRASAENIAALRKIRDCLEIRHELDMKELNIKGLAVDDALAYLLIGFSQRHTEIADILDIDSRMTRILNYSGVE